MSNEEIANAVVNELTLAYMQAGSKISTANAIDVAKSLCESLDFKDAVEVKAAFRRSKMVQDIPTQRTLAEALANHRAETYSQAPSLPLIENRDPRAAWLPKEPLLQKINFHESAKRYCIAIDRLNGNDKAYAGFRNAYSMTKDGSRYVYVRPDAARAYDEMMRGTLTRIYERFWRLLPMAKGYPANMPVTLGGCPPSVAEYMEMFRRERKNAG